MLFAYSFCRKIIRYYRPLGAVILLPVILAVTSACGTTPVRIDGGMSLPQKKVLLSARLMDKAALLEVSADGSVVPSGILPKEMRGVKLTSPGSFQDLFYAEGDGGLHLFLPKKKKYFLVPRGSKGLNGDAIRNIHVTRSGREYRFLVTYLAPRGGGVTDCRVGGDLTSFTCTSLNKRNSDLKSDRVHETVFDHAGNLWFRYSPRDLAGISRLKKNGNWQHFDRNNSDLGDNAVSIIHVEKKNRGFTGENIWFVTRAGLSRLRYDKKEEEWKLFGEKHSLGDTITRAMGIDTWFSDAIVGIVDLAVRKDHLMIATKYAVYRFKEGNVNRFAPKEAGGLDELRIRSMVVRGDTVFVVISPQRDPRREIVAIKIFKIKDRTWHSLKYWGLNRQYPRHVKFFSIDSDHDAIVFSYGNRGDKAALLLHSNFTLQPLVLPRSPAGK